MNYQAIIEARMTSTRLPGKVVLPILGRPVLSHLIERLQQCQKLDGVVIATTTNKTDDVLEELAFNSGVGCFRGSEEDVLERVLLAAKKNAVDVIVEITGDCPLVDPSIVDELIGIHEQGAYDYVSNNMRRTYPRGLDTQVFSTEVLAKVADLTDDPVDHEHVSLYIYEHPEIFSLFNLDSGLDEQWWDLRLTLDTREDYELINKIFTTLYPSNPKFGMQDILIQMKMNPEWININQHVEQKKVR